MNSSALLSLLQLASPALPVGAYSYSEGLEILVEQEIITDVATLEQWLRDALKFGSPRLDGALLHRSYAAMEDRDMEQLRYWNHWSLAIRETEELRQQTAQMGRSLSGLLQELDSSLGLVLQELLYQDTGEPGYDLSYTTGWAIACAHWQIVITDAILAYLHGWVANAIAAGVKLIPLGQTSGQKLLFQLHPQIAEIVPEILALDETNLYSCSWGFAMASTAHETQYTRLFRS
ncbi:urease accessory protein UreF [Roseofilum casamattae]|uniref:Urease accessory protein UreF n=1 Tax=Roseofilum casamattae BLCC-M143 TaxID=3022442 RepID=A0ABT7BVX5_9CYAN|nr:urease accessory protein UreF [Roseofilum casamattae]MDJ1183344.1 urease accessory protein UreF [Roseofilum casamattae BLCC-M143]